MVQESEIESLADLIRKAKGACVVFTGAGMSAESGISTFRGTDGIWEEFPPDTFGTLTGLLKTFLIQYPRFRQFLGRAADSFLDARPNPGHHALAALEKAGLMSGIITQNVDNLHQTAGSQEVIELHGNYYEGRCRRCKEVREVGRSKVTELVQRLNEASGRIAFIKTYRQYGPKCPSCKVIVRPNMVLFGEALSSRLYEDAATMAERCKVMLVVGTSVMVRPASDIPYIAHHAGATVVEINTEPGALAPIVEQAVVGPSGEVLAALVAAIENR